jgi:CHASE3 domain sensor protein
VKNYNTYLLTVFLGFVVLTIGIASYAYYKFDALQERVANVKHTTMVIDQAEYSLYVLREVESDQRGYLLTNDPDFLPTFYNAQFQERKAFETLAQPHERQRAATGTTCQVG